MSAAPPSPPVPPVTTLAVRVMEWSRPVIAIFGLVIFALSFWMAWQNRAEDNSTFQMLVGAIVALVTSISGYYFGSSSGSQKKDDVINNALVTAQAKPPTGG